jgi:hypothetical protein
MDTNLANPDHTVRYNCFVDNGLAFSAGGDYASTFCPEAEAPVAVYDPEGGFVTGGGWIDSPTEACHLTEACQDATGEATFGFVARYSKKTKLPEGKTEFQFKAGGLNVHSTSYDWLVVNQGGTNAQFKGMGTINGTLDPQDNPYKFMLWAGDGEPDTFRIKIWYEEDKTEHIVYDNSMDQPIAGGNIVVHKAK